MKKKYLSLVILPLLVIGVSSCDSIVIMDSREDINPTDPNKTSEEDPNTYSIEVVSYPSSVEVGKSSPVNVNLITETEDEETIIEEGTNANLVLISSDSSTLSVSKTSVVGVKVGHADLTVRWVAHPEASVTIEDIEVVIGYTYDISLSYYITPEEDEEGDDEGNDEVDDDGDGNTGDNGGDDGDNDADNTDDTDDTNDDTDNDDNDDGDNEGEGNDDDNTEDTDDDDDDEDEDEDDDKEEEDEESGPEEASSITLDIDDTLSLYDFTIRLGTLEDDGTEQTYTQVVFTDDEYEGNDTVKFISTDEEVLQVSEDGESVTALSSGRAYLSVTWVDHDVSSNTIRINVNAAPEPEQDPENPDDDPNGGDPDGGDNPDGGSSQGDGNNQDDPE